MLLAAQVLTSVQMLIPAQVLMAALGVRLSWPSPADWTPRAL